MKKPTILLLATVLFATAAQARTLFITTPDLCSKVEKQEGDKVFLQTAKACPQMRGKMPLSVEGDVKELEVYVNGKFWQKETPAAFEMGNVKDLQRRGEGIATSLPTTRPTTENEQKARDLASAASSFYYSNEYQKQLETEKTRIATEVFERPAPTLAPSNNEDERLGDPEGGSIFQPNERVYVFVSSSVPLQTIRRYAEDIEKLGPRNVFFVMRGMINGMDKVAPTMKWLADGLAKDPLCTERPCDSFTAPTEIDPYLFRRYQITSVPAIVYVSNLMRLDEEGSEGLTDSASTGETFTYYGDVGLGYSLAAINEVAPHPSLKKASLLLNNRNR